MNRKYVLLLLLIPIMVGLMIGIHAYGTYTGLKTYKAALSDGNLNRSISSAENLSKQSGQLMSDLNMPVIKQISHIFGLDFSPIKSDISELIKASPYIAGAERPKKFLIAFQNTAEARGTGGILGAFAVVEFNKGNAKIIKSGSNSALASLSEIPVPVTDEFLRLYGQNPAILQNSNLSPHFPYGAKIWLGLYQRQFGEDLDGVIAVDPTALSYVLRATGSVQANGKIIDNTNVVDETLKDAYKRYEKNNNARKQYLVQIINATTKKLMNSQYSRIEMAKAIRQGIIERRILVYSVDAQAEKKISASKVGGFLSTTPNNEYRVVIQNIDASKLDYYLQKNVDISSTSCGAGRKTTVTVDVSNTLTTGKGLPAYVLTRADKNKPESLVTGAHRFKVFVYGPVGSKIESAWRKHLSEGIGGQSTERKRPVMVMDVDLAPQKSEKLQVNFVGGKGKITFVDQPLVRPTLVGIQDRC